MTGEKSAHFPILAKERRKLAGPEKQNCH